MGALKKPFNEAVALELANGKSQPDAVRIACGKFNRRPMSPENSRRHVQRARGLLRRVDEIRDEINEKNLHAAKVTRDWVLQRCFQIAGPDLGLDELRYGDQIGALRLAAQVIGALAPDKFALTDPSGTEPAPAVVINLMRTPDAELMRDGKP